MNLIPERLSYSDTRSRLEKTAFRLKSWSLSTRQLCDLELIMNGSFFPLQGFLGQKDYDSVVHDMRLHDGSLWPIPITLDVTEAFAKTIELGDEIALRAPDGTILAVLLLQDKWVPNKQQEARFVYGSDSMDHPGVSYLYKQAGTVYLGGSVEGLRMPQHHSFLSYRHTPNELRRIFQEKGWTRIVAFQTRNPIHRAHFELTLRAAEKTQAKLLIHPAVGTTKPGDIDKYTRLRCYEAVLDQYPASLTVLSLLNLSMRMAGGREAIWHGMIRRNCGCTHFIVGRDHAGPGLNSDGKCFYRPYEAQELFRKHEEEIGIELVHFKKIVYVKNPSKYSCIDEVEKSQEILEISGTELRKRLCEGWEIPEWFTFPRVALELRRRHPPQSKRGYTVLFTGLSAAGKSTIAHAVQAKLMELDIRPVTLLDGDIIRKNLSPELGFTRKDRDMHVRRVGFIASEITKNGGVAICALIAPYEQMRQQMREIVLNYGDFIEVYVATDIEECRRRDHKGLYVLAKDGKLKGFTGVSDPYEVPANPDLHLETEGCEVGVCALQVVSILKKRGLITSASKMNEGRLYDREAAV